MTESMSDATLSDRKQVFYLQSSCLQDLLSTQGHDNLVLTDDFKIPELLMNRFLSDDLSSQGRKIDNEEATLLSILDGKGRISTSARLTEFMVVMSRVYKVDHRALCIHALATKLSEQCEKDFLKFGGYRIIKRWFQLAENEDSVGELVKLLKLCRKLPFDEAAIREANIGKVIRKLKKFKSSKAGVGEMNTQIENIMTKWRAKQQQLAEMAAVLAKNNSTVVDAAVPMDIQDSTGVKQKDDVRVGGPIVSTSHPTIDQLSSTEGVAPTVKNQIVKNNNSSSSVSNGDGQAPQQLLVTTGRSKPLGSSVAPPAISFTGGIIRDVSATGTIVTAGFTPSSAATTGVLNLATSFPNSATADISQRFQMNGPVATTSAVATENKPIVTVPPARERKPLDMAESARRLLAMRAEKQQQQQSQLQQPIDSTNMTNGAVATDESSSSTTASAPTVTSILSAVGKESIMNGLAKALKDNEPAPLRSALKKSSGDSKKKRVVQWADETGGLLREIHTIEVERIKRSTAHYSNTRELSKKERQFEKETHLSKVNEAMQKNTDWRTPAPLVLSIAVLDNMSTAAESKEKEAQDKRLLHVLEVRYLDDSLIPNDPDDASTTSEAPSSSFFNISSSASVVNQSSATASTATVAAAVDDDDCSDCQLMPWYVPGTEPTDLNDSSNGWSMSTPYHAADGFTNDVLLMGGGGGGGRSNMLSGAPSNYSMNNNYMNNDLQQFNGNFDSHFMNIVSQLPLSLQRLDMQSLQILVYDPSQLQSLLLSDGTVDKTRLANFQQQRNMNNNFANSNASQQQQRFSRFDSTHQQTAFNPPMPMGNAILNRNSNGGDNSDMLSSSGFRKPNSRWGDKAVNDQSVLADQSSLAYPQSFNNNSFPTHSLPHNNNNTNTLQQRPMSIIPNSGNMFNPDGSIHNQQLFGDWSGDQRMNNPMDSSMAYDSTMKRPISQVSTIDHSAKNLTKFPSTKAATPCRFFNTVKGCQFGDKCPFGHFLGSAPMKNNFSRQSMAPAIDPFQSNIDNNNNNNMMSSSMRSNTRFGQVQQQQQPLPYGAAPSSSSFQPMGGSSSSISDERSMGVSGPGSIASHYGPGSMGGAKGKQRRLK